MPHVDKVFGMAIKLERQLLGAGNINIVKEPIHANAILTEAMTDRVIAVVGNLNTGNNVRRFIPNSANKYSKCTYCGMIGHTIERCYKKHGYPLGWIPGYKTKNKQTQNLGNTISAYVITNQPTTSTGQDIGIGISSEQFQKLVSMIQNKVGHTVPNTSTAATVTTTAFGLTTNLKATGRQSSEGGTWYEDDWFC
ncbi:PREDICTED: uncharacterized protein LOC109163006 [Ipomoea nil]|uniref:uncharacterized protein LOC109163006 n=1 Tax=Ipomoea nil TaxID=35883 RepID=UPI0009011CC4|nr:PREDICTED: uncharacterized protein LOC109163006 [Ipomoea nil]